MKLTMVILITSLPIVITYSSACSAGTANQSRNRSLVPAVQLITEAFDQYPLVAFSEPRHAATGMKKFMSSLIRHPGFAGKVNDIVVEFGNARYQAIVDRYIAGETVPRDELRQVWENTTIVTGVWSAPVYEAVLTDIRTTNRTLPPHQRIRVLLGDPPIDWKQVRGPADEDMNDWRDAHFAWVVQEQVIKRGRRALLWIGGAHISRRVRFPESLIHLLDRSHPNRTLVALAIDARDVNAEVTNQFSPWPGMAAVPVHNTWLGRQDVTAIGAKLSTGTVEENVDVAIFWESPSGVSDESPRVDPASPFAAELERRRRLSETTVAFRGGGIRFLADTPAFTPQSAVALQTVLEELSRNTDLSLLVKAFTDSHEVGGVELSWARARAVVKWLTERGISSERLSAKGCGSSRALWFGHSERERAANRRAELVRLSKLVECGPPTSFELYY